MVPLHARSARLASMRFYRRRRQRIAFRKAQRVMRTVNANRIRIAAVIGSLVLIFVELGFALGVVVQRWHG